MSGAFEQRTIRRWNRVSGDPEPDDVVVEAPLELRDRAGKSLLVTMRTPGRDLDLARGLLFAEGVLQDPTEAAKVTRVDAGELHREEQGNVVRVDLDQDLLKKRFAERAQIPVSSACGACGAANIASLEVRAEAIRSELQVSGDLIASLPERLRIAQEVFGKTGGLHAAGIFSAAGEALCVREDVGRHNAMDKVVGWALGEERLPLSEQLVCVSGRLGFEIAQKAVMAGVPIVVAVSAPSSLAIDVAERFRLTLCGFTRRGTFNIYSHPARVL